HSILYLSRRVYSGWYRECNIIPHTTDVDFAAPIEEYTPKLLNELFYGGEFFLSRTLGLVSYYNTSTSKVS
ncbi:unnamed protein product, partial [Haemonchus placei]|uniref:Nucleotidyltransferase family protein n=1 Tax=Haemonchus placei TaxID=6290 RepID=A0A0N4X5N9_HAEPC